MQKRLEPLQSNKANALGYRDEHGGNGEGLGQRRDPHGEDNTALAPQGAHPQQHPAPVGFLEAGVRPRHRDAPRMGSSRCQKRRHRPGTWWSRRSESCRILGRSPRAPCSRRGIWTRRGSEGPAHLRALRSRRSQSTWAHLDSASAAAGSPTARAHMERIWRGSAARPRPAGVKKRPRVGRNPSAWGLTRACPTQRKRRLNFHLG